MFCVYANGDMLLQIHVHQLTVLKKVGVCVGGGALKP